MFASILFLVISFLTALADNKVGANIPNLDGYYYMSIPDNDNQYVFNIDYSPSFNRHIVTVTGQSLAWATATINITNDTSIDLVCDNGNILSGIISYSTDLPTICWPKFKDFTCWKHLLSNITRIHVINMNHLDVGYNGIPTTGFINNILNIYFHQYFPRAAILAEQIRRISPYDTFVYTTHPWLLSMFFDCPSNLVLAGIQLKCPSKDELELIERAIRTGAITWHAGAMNMQYEWMDERALNQSLDLSVSLAKRFNVPVPCVISVRDVPGIPIAIIRSLNQYFSQYCSFKSMVTVGVNAAVTDVDVPKGVFRWGTSDDLSVLATWHVFGYPNNPGSTFASPGGLSLDDLVIVPEIGIGLAFAFRTDNQGPPMSIAEIRQNHEILRQSYPNAQIISSSLQNFLEDIAGIAPELELFDRDISDSWLQGIGSDPKRVQQYQALQRALATCFERKLCTTDDDQLVNASRYLIKIPEHTWGLPSLYDEINWSNKQFEKVVNTMQTYNNCRLAWLEQRKFFDLYLETVNDHPLYNLIQQELRSAFDNVKKPNLDHFKAVSPTETFILFAKSSNPIHVSFDKNLGSISNLSRSNTIYWTDKTSQLGTYVYITYNETDFDHLTDTYGNPGYDKPNSTVNANPASQVWLPSLKKFYRSRTDDNTFLALLNLDTTTTDLYGGFGEIWLTYKFLDETSLQLEWMGLNKTATRLAEASMIKFLLPMQPSCSLIQYDTKVDVQQAANKSSYFQRGVDTFSCQTSLSSKCFVTLNVKSYDAPIACPILQGKEPTALPFPAPGNSPPLDGMAYNLHNNVWDTNYIYWYPLVNGDESWRARFLITFDGSCS
ncbi:unnamed protein product [Adineta steineri]|uniref:Uncharacterized protein n=1 Tax=Adineta steineri TaxID=433720 RepID=A0A819G7L2_9BILA|nr:unnamed protein product [Adineta steineri]CAF3881055.1 unnamed protein product [Adineta steineri]